MLAKGLINTVEVIQVDQQQGSADRVIAMHIQVAIYAVEQCLSYGQAGNGEGLFGGLYWLRAIDRLRAAYRLRADYRLRAVAGPEDAGLAGIHAGEVIYGELFDHHFCQGW